MDDDRPRQLAAGEDLDRVFETSRDALGEKHLGRYGSVNFDGLEAANIHHFPRRAVNVREAALVRHSLLDRQLPALEPTPHSGTAARFLTLGSPAGRLR